MINHLLLQYKERTSDRIGTWRRLEDGGQYHDRGGVQIYKLEKTLSKKDQMILFALDKALTGKLTGKKPSESAIKALSNTVVDLSRYLPKDFKGIPKAPSGRSRTRF